MNRKSCAARPPLSNIVHGTLKTHVVRSVFARLVEPVRLYDQDIRFQKYRRLSFQAGKVRSVDDLEVLARYLILQDVPDGSRCCRPVISLEGGHSSLDALQWYPRDSISRLNERSQQVTEAYLDGLPCLFSRVQGYRAPCVRGHGPAKCQQIVQPQEMIAVLVGDQNC